MRRPAVSWWRPADRALAADNLFGELSKRVAAIAAVNAIGLHEHALHHDRVLAVGLHIVTSASAATATRVARGTVP